MHLIYQTPSESYFCPNALTTPPYVGEIVGPKTFKTMNGREINVLGRVSHVRPDETELGPPMALVIAL